MNTREKIAKLEARVAKLERVLKLSQSKGTKVDEVVKWLRTKLKEEGGEIPSDVIYEMAADDGIGQSTLKKAKRKLGVDSIKRGRDWLWVRG